MSKDAYIHVRASREDQELASRLAAARGLSVADLLSDLLHAEDEKQRVGSGDLRDTLAYAERLLTEARRLAEKVKGKK